jgi:hypothetical protein
MSHCWQRGAEILLGDQSHMHINEQGGISSKSFNLFLLILYQFIKSNEKFKKNMIHILNV